MTSDECCRPLKLVLTFKFTDVGHLRLSRLAHLNAVGAMHFCFKCRLSMELSGTCI